jgi:hypothetical protein
VSPCGIGLGHISALELFEDIVVARMTEVIDIYDQILVEHDFLVTGQILKLLLGDDW